MGVSSPDESLILHASETFADPVWKTLVDEQSGILFIESRNVETQTVNFSAWDVPNKRFLWQSLQFEEKWWLTLGYAGAGMLLFTHYADTNNPDKKSVMAYDVVQQQLKWWKNNFVVANVNDNIVVGADTKFGSRELMVDIRTGDELKESVNFSPSQNFMVIRPLQYFEQTEHFNTVKDFIERKCAISATQLIEYCEHRSLIIISAFAEEGNLANYLMVFNSEGDIVLKEQLGENLKGIAFDTFFILTGFLIFVKNKRELISYRFV